MSDPLNHVLGGYSRFRRYTPRMLLRTLDIEASPLWVVELGDLETKGPCPPAAGCRARRPSGRAPGLGSEPGPSRYTGRRRTRDAVADAPPPPKPSSAGAALAGRGGLGAAGPRRGTLRPSCRAAAGG